MSEVTEMSEANFQKRNEINRLTKLTSIHSLWLETQIWTDGKMRPKLVSKSNHVLLCNWSAIDTKEHALIK